MDEKTIARFWAKVDKRGSDECWEWTGARNEARGGYGAMGRNVMAHRASWEIHNRQLTSGECVLHRCDNPPCCNPAHLFVGTRTDNHLDKMAKGRNKPPPRHLGNTHPMAKLTEESIPRIRAALASGIGKQKVAAAFGVSKKTVLNIAAGRIWRHVP